MCLQLWPAPPTLLAPTFLRAALAMRATVALSQCRQPRPTTQARALVRRQLASLGFFLDATVAKAAIAALACQGGFLNPRLSAYYLFTILFI